MAESNRRFITTDVEITDAEQDFLGWTCRAQNLATALALPTRPTPFTLGVQGDWGSGKTSFINLALSYLGTPVPGVTPGKDTPLADRMLVYRHDFSGLFRKLPHSHVYLIKFDSWVFTQAEVDVDYLFPLYVVQVLRDYLLASGKLKSDAPEATLAQRMARTLPRVGRGLATMGVGLAEIALPGTSKVIEGIQYITGAGGEQKVSAEARVDAGALLAQLVRFKPDFRALVDELLAADADQKVLLEKIKPPYNRMIIVVDDLDRVPPVTAVNITEKVKLFMDVPGCIFILAADLQVIQQGLEKKLGKEITEEEGKNYLDKIVKIQYQVPPISRAQVNEIVRRQEFQLFNLAFVRNDVCDPLVVDLLFAFPMIAANPRSLKRLMNTFDFTMLVLLGTDEDPRPDDSYRVLALQLLDQYEDQAMRRFSAWLGHQNPPALLDGQLAAQQRLWESLSSKARQEQKGGDENLRAYVAEIAKRAYTIAAWQSALSLSAFSGEATAPGG